MRLFFLFLGLLSPRLLLAQFNSFAPGSYVLASSPTVRHETTLKLRDNGQLVAKGPDGKTLRLSPEDVSSFRLGPQKFIAAGGFATGTGLGGDFVSRAFVEQLDSGRVMLLRYQYPVGGPPMMGGPDGRMTGGPSRPPALYLLRNGYSITPIPANGRTGTAGGRKFREALLPYLRARPDLVGLLNDKHILEEDLPAVVRALNTGRPMPPTPSYLNRE